MTTRLGTLAAWRSALTVTVSPGDEPCARVVTVTSGVDDGEVVARLTLQRPPAND